jgi:hypothetical protein
VSDPSHVDATFYAQVEPIWSRYNRTRLEGAKVVTLTQKKPDSPRGGTVTVKLTVRVPAAAFLPLQPEAVVVVPDDMTATTPVVAVAEDPA